MPSFDFTSEVDMAAMKNAVDIVSRQVDNRYDCLLYTSRCV